jgi:hypothetical protein
VTPSRSDFPLLGSRIRGEDTREEGSGSGIVGGGGRRVVAMVVALGFGFVVRSTAISHRGGHEGGSVRLAMGSEGRYLSRGRQAGGTRGEVEESEGGGWGTGSDEAARWRWRRHREDEDRSRDTAAH